MAMKVKILSYIANMNKLLYGCPFCRAQNSMILKTDEIKTASHKCAQCRKSYEIDISALELDKEN